VRWRGLQDLLEPLSGCALVLIGIDVEVAVLDVEVRMRAVAEVAKVPTRYADASIDSFLMSIRVIPAMAVS